MLDFLLTSIMTNEWVFGMRGQERTSAVVIVMYVIRLPIQADNLFMGKMRESKCPGEHESPEKAHGKGVA